MKMYLEGKRIKATTVEDMTTVEYYYDSPYYYKRTFDQGEPVMDCIEETLRLYEKNKGVSRSAKLGSDTCWHIAHGAVF